MKKILILMVTIITFTNSNAQSNDSLFYRHSLQFNAAGLGIERFAVAYELRMTPKHALFLQTGGSFPYISEEKEYGVALHYKYFFPAVKESKFLWLFKSAYRNTFADLNIRYMNLDGIYKESEFLFEAIHIGPDIGQTWVWKSGFTISYWLGYGLPITSKYEWKNTIPEDGESWKKTYKYGSGLDFGFALGYSFGGNKNR